MTVGRHVMSDSRKIYYADAQSDNNGCQMPQMSNFENSNWRTTAILKSVI